MLQIAEYESFRCIEHDKRVIDRVQGLLHHVATEFEL
jgi:hypothetical protein